MFFFPVIVTTLVFMTSMVGVGLFAFLLTTKIFTREAAGSEASEPWRAGQTAGASLAARDTAQTAAERPVPKQDFLLAWEWGFS